VWDLAAGKGRSLIGHDGGVQGALVLPDWRVLSWSTDRRLRLWDLATGEGRPLTGYEGWIDGALTLRDGRVLLWGRDGAQVWNLATGEERLLTSPEEWVKGALELPNQRLVSWSNRTFRYHVIDGSDAALVFHFDATPTVVIPDGSQRFVVGDGLGRVHFLELVEDASASGVGEPNDAFWHKHRSGDPSSPKV
jgi:hypothetical protein